MSEPSHWPPLSRSQARRLDRLAVRNRRLLSDSELVEMQRLVGWALYADEADEDGYVERHELSDEERQGLRSMEQRVNGELGRRYRESGAVPRSARAEVVGWSRTPVPVRRARAKARPREHRARTGRSRARSPGGSSNDDPPDDPDLEPVSIGGG